MITTCVLLITAVLFMAGGSFYAPINSPIHKQSSLILLVAAIVYGIMGIEYSNDPDINLRIYRYLDWSITVPLMVYQMITLSSGKYKNFNLIYCVFTSILMLGFGFLGEASYIPKNLAGIISIAFALFTFLPLFNQIDARTNKIYYTLMVGWLFYPIVYFVTDTANVIYLYSIVDLVVKMGFAHYLYKKIA